MPLHSPRGHGRLHTLARWLARGVAMLMAIIILAWFTGRVVSDRFVWSQWLLWIPTPAVMLAAALGWCGNRWSSAGQRRAVRGRGPRRRWLWPTMLGCAAAYFLLIEHRFFHRGAPVARGDNSLKLMHWNMGHWKRRLIPHMAGLVMDFDADLAVITDGGGLAGDAALREWLGADAEPPTLHPFTILTRLPILQLRPLVFSDGIVVSLLEVDADARLGRTLCIYMVDLPSELREGRWETALRARRLMDDAMAQGAPPPDLVVGDFNMTRGAALARMFPSMEHAWAQGGHGYAASFPRGFDLYHIDHMLVGEGMRCERYDLVDAGMGRHRAQVAWISPRP